MTVITSFSQHARWGACRSTEMISSAYDHTAHFGAFETYHVGFTNWVIQVVAIIQDNIADNTD